MAESMDLRGIELLGRRVRLKSFTAEDAPDAFAPVTPALTRFMAWEPSPSLEAFAEVWRTWLPRMATGNELMLAIREKSTAEFLGMAGLHGIDALVPELGIWIKPAADGQGFGREACAAVVSWGSA